jgi:hypothetical protein
MFVDQALASTIERVEARLTRDAVLGVQRQARNEGAFALELAGGIAGFVRAGSPMNKIIGAGMFAPIDDLQLEQVESRYRERSEPVRIELATLAAPETAQRLTERGYRLCGFENVLGRALDDILVPEPAGVRVVNVDDEGLPEWQRVLTEGFAAPDGPVRASRLVSLRAVHRRGASHRPAAYGQLGHGARPEAPSRRARPTPSAAADHRQPHR